MERKISLESYDKETDSIRIKVHHPDSDGAIPFSIDFSKSPEEVFNNFVFIVEDLVDTNKIDKDKIVNFFFKCKEKVANIRKEETPEEAVKNQINEIQEDLSVGY